MTDRTPGPFTAERFRNPPILMTCGLLSLSATLTATLMLFLVRLKKIL